MKVTALVLAWLFAWTGLAAAQPVAPDIQRILDRGRLVVAMYHLDTPPFYFQDEAGRLTGFDVRLIQGFAARLGVEVVFNRRAKSFDQLVDEVARGEADLAISKLSRTFGRAMRVRYSRPYLVLRQGLLVNRLEFARQSQGMQPEQALRNITGKIGVIMGSSYEDFARQRFPSAKILAFPTWAETLAAAARGEVLAAYRDEIEVKKIIRSSPDSLINFQTVVLSDTRDPIAVAVNRDAPNLLALVDTYLEDLALSATADSILDEYMPVRPGRQRR